MVAQRCAALGCCYAPAEANGVPWCFYTPVQYQDFYFLGHGLDFKRALREFAALSGPVPIPPRYALGPQYSRWYAHSMCSQLLLL